MRYLFAATAALCFASSAAAAVSIPIVPVGKWATVTFHGVGQVSSLEIQNPMASNPIFEGILGQSVRISVSFGIWRETEDDIPFADQLPTRLMVTRMDNGLSWGGFSKPYGFLNSSELWVEEDPSWWGYAVGTTYNLVEDFGWFGLRLYHEDDASEMGFSWSEAQGQWTISKVTVSVPEPASWALLITGFGIVGASLRRQRRAGPAPAWSRPALEYRPG